MKQVFTCALLVLLAVSCNDNATATKNDSTGDTTESTATAATNLVYPYTLAEPYADWQIGDQAHVVTVLNSLKAFETGDIATCVKGFGDTVNLRFDGYHAKLSNDSLLKVFTQQRGELTSSVVTMNDWESVISKDKTKEYVTIWYKEVKTYKNGKVDSLAIVDDAKIVNGKIVELDQKIQHFPTKKI